MRFLSIFRGALSVFIIYSAVASLATLVPDSQIAHLAEYLWFLRAFQ